MELLLTRLKSTRRKTFMKKETDLMLEVEAWTEQAVCPRCGDESSHLHQNHGYWLKTNPISNRQVCLR